MSHILLETGVNNKKIESLSKSSKSYELEGDGRFVGHRFALGGKLYGDKRCIHCGKWFHWVASDEDKWFLNRNIDETVADRVEPAHCGSTHCRDYHYEWLKHLERKHKEEMAKMDKTAMSLFKDLKRKGLV